MAGQDDLQAGLAAHQGGDLVRAAEIYDACLKQMPDNADLLHLRGLLHHQSGDNPSALSFIDKAIERSPGTALYQGSRGAVLLATGDVMAARDALEAARNGRPDDPKILTNLGLALGRSGDPEAARQLHDQALSADPSCVDALINRGNLAERQDDIEAAISDLTAARDLSPGNPDILNNLGFACLSGNCTDQARQALTQALALAPDHVEAAINLAHLELLTGNFAEGWRGYEARRRRSGWRIAHLDCPEWRGQDPAGKTILIVCEQGYGDAIQFVRHAIDLLDRGATIDILADACITDLLETVPGVRQVVSHPTANDWDYWVPAMSLPNQLALQGPPAIGAAYLSAPRTIVNQTWGVGFCYSGNPRHKNDARRSLSVADAKALLAGRDEHFVSLNLAGQFESDELPPGMQGRTDIENFTDLARSIVGLDLVITVDTAVAHLAGALGRPCWLLLPFAPDWRWGMIGETTPLYPSVRLFRQTTPGDWLSVLGRVRAELDAMA